MIRNIIAKLRDHSFIYAVVSIYWAIYLLIYSIYELTFHVDTALYFLLYGGIYAYFALILVIAAKIPSLANSEDNLSLLRRLMDWFRYEFTVGDRVANGLNGMILLSGTIIVFSTFKSSIPAINPFNWDEYFMHMDRAIFGTDPWIILQFLFGYMYVTAFISLMYNLWILVVISVLTFAAFSRSSDLRSQFLLSAILAWALAGNVMAIIFSSAGPCYYGEIVAGNDPYLQQMQYLRYVHEMTGMIWALDIQDTLWLAYENSGRGVSGISAMPSLHVIFSLLMAIYGMRLNRFMGLALVVFAVFIMIGSVHLGWHYAVDSLVAVPLAFGFWVVSGRLVRISGGLRRDLAEGR